MKRLGLLVVLVVAAFLIGITGAPGHALETAAGWLLGDTPPSGYVVPTAQGRSDPA